MYQALSDGIGKKKAPAELQRILTTHNEALKSLALHDDDFFQFICNWFSFPTSEGYMTLETIKSRTKLLLHVPHIDQFRQLLPIAKANGQLIVNSGYIHDKQIFDKLARFDRSATYQAIDAAYFGNIFNDLEISLYDSIAHRIAALQEHLEAFNCALFLKRFHPEAIPAIFYMSQDKLLERDLKNIQSESGELWQDITSSLFSFNKEYDAQLFLNYDNPLIRQLLEKQDRNSDRLFVEMIYLNSLMLGHYPLNAQELNLMNNNMLRLLQAIV